jgi:hypothetical protein
MPQIARNYTTAGAFRVRAICQCCGHQSRPVLPEKDGEPDLWKMGRGWSTAPFPAGYRHADGSVGSNFTCPACNKRLRSGETLQVRAYMGGTACVRRVME